MVQRSSVVLGGIALVLVLIIAGLATRLWLKRASTPIARAAVRAPVVKPLVLEVTTTQISLDGAKVLELDPSQRARGAAAEQKERGVDDASIVPLIQALKRSRSATPGQTELAVRLAPDAPYRILVESMISASNAGYQTYRLSTASPPLELLATMPEPGVQESVAAIVSKDGIQVSTLAAGSDRGQNVGSDCRTPAPGLAIANSTDFAALGACLRTLRKTFASAPVGIVTANASAPAWQVLSVAHAFRCGEARCPPTWPGPDLYSPIHFRTINDGPPSARAEQVRKLRPALRACYQAELGRRSQGNYDFTAKIQVKTQGRAELSLTPTLPEPFASCVRQALSSLVDDMAKEPVGAAIRVPLRFTQADAP